MDNQKNNKVVIVLLIVIIVILSVLCVLFATGTISFNSNKVNNNDIKENVNNNNQNSEVENNTQNDDNFKEEKLPEWSSYLLKQNIKNITVKRTFKGEGFDPSVGCLESKQITNENLTQILEKMTKGKLTKHLDAGGFGGPCLTNIVIEYNENGKLELFLYEYIITKDEKILSLLEKEQYTENNTYNNSLIDEPNTLFAYEWDNSFVETLFK